MTSDNQKNSFKEEYILKLLSIINLFAKLQEQLSEKDELVSSQAQLELLSSYFQGISQLIQDFNSHVQVPIQKKLLENIRFLAQKRQECQDLYQESEYILENHLYNLTTQSSDPETISEYKDHELRAVGIAKQDIELAIKFHGEIAGKKCLFVGCGALPITSTQMVLQNPSLKVDLLDMSDEAISKAQKMVQKLNLQENITCLKPIRIEDFKEIGNYDVVWFAIMVGSNKEEKIKIYSEVYKNLRPEQIIITRTVPEDSFSEFLYSPFPIKELANKYQFLNERSEKSCIVNSIALKKI